MHYTRRSPKLAHVRSPIICNNLTVVPILYAVDQNLVHLLVHIIFPCLMPFVERELNLQVLGLCYENFDKILNRNERVFFLIYSNNCCLA